MFVYVLSIIWFSSIFTTSSEKHVRVKFMFSKKATKFDKIFTVDLTLCSRIQIDGEDFVNFCGLLRKQELYTDSPFSICDILKKVSRTMFAKNTFAKEQINF